MRVCPAGMGDSTNRRRVVAKTANGKNQKRERAACGTDLGVGGREQGSLW